MRDDAFFHGQDYHKVEINDIRVDNMKVGIADFERHPDKRQLIMVDVALYRLAGAFTGTDITDCINYVDVISKVTREWPQRPHTDLLETLLEELVQFCFTDQKVDAARVKITKPHVFNGYALPSVEFFRVRDGKAGGR